jgi:3-oxoadipate enol-lactonase
MYLKTDVGSVYYRAHGPEDAPAVVFLHGVAMDHRTFESQVEALESRYRVIVWDMPYHGYSSPIDKNRRFSTTAADFTMAILDELHIHQATLAGLSLGSLVAQQAACHYPDRVNGLVHISGGPLYPRFPALLKAAIPFISAFMKLYPVKPLNKAFVEHKALAKETKAYLLETIAHTGKDVVTHLTNEMVRDMVIGLPEHSAHPALIVYGDHELRFIRKMAERWHDSHPNSRLVEVQDAHHILNQDNPAGFHAVLLEFLQEVLEDDESSTQEPGADTGAAVHPRSR